MPDILVNTAITFAIAVLAALLVAWVVGHNAKLANFVGIDQVGLVQ